jgi:hypothetical protein
MLLSNQILKKRNCDHLDIEKDFEIELLTKLNPDDLKEDE